MLCNVEDVREIVKALKEAHPYEEVGYDIYPLLNLDE